MKVGNLYKNKNNTVYVIVRAVYQCRWIYGAVHLQDMKSSLLGWHQDITEVLDWPHVQYVGHMSEITYSETIVAIGQIWQHDSGDRYIVTQIDIDGPLRYQLTCLNTGNRWTTAKPNIKDIFSNSRHRFTLVGSGA